MNVRVPESDEVKQHAKHKAREADFRLLESRVRRHLLRGRLILHKTRGQKQAALFGRYWVSDRMKVMPILHHVDLPALARRLHIYFDDLASLR